MNPEPDLIKELRKQKDMAKLMLGKKYDNTIRPFKEIIEIVMKSNNETALQALVRISGTNLYTEKVEKQMMFQAATIDIHDAN